MYKFYNIIISNDVAEYTLTYKLKSHKPAQLWADIMSKVSIAWLRPSFYPWRGINIDPAASINKLLILVEELNQWLPKKINKVWDFNDIQKSVNEFHTHFPEHQSETDLSRREQLRRYNDLIHSIETMNMAKIANSTPLHLLICPDTPENMTVPYELDDYQYFDGNRKFGDLTIGYNHIGKHPIEIFKAGDVDIPTNQILPERLIGPIHYLFFYDYMFSKDKFNEFYYNSKIKWPYELSDPRLAVGSVNIGNLKYINDKILQRDEIFSIINSCNKIINWNIDG